MQPSLEEIDRATLILLQALADHGDAVAPYFEAGHLEALQRDLTTLRQALLGLEMGLLYWQVQGGDETHGDSGSGRGSGSG